MTVYSKSLISELKTFVAKGTTFKAKEKEHDDLVAALLLVVRMIMMLGDWDPAVYQKLIEDARLEDFDLPMPIHISSF
jgi:hypothetical protein